MELGNEVRTCVSLPGVPAGTIGTVEEIGQLFVVVKFGDGRVGYYAPQQLEPVPTADAAGEYASLGFGEERVPYGSHLCLLPSSKNDLMGTMARYTAAGFEEREKCFCIFPEEWMPSVQEAMGEGGVDLKDAVASGQLIVRSSAEVYLKPSEFTAEKQLARARKVLASLLPGGRSRARVFGFAGAELFDVAEWWEYELRATAVLKASGVLGMCAYQPSGWRTDQWARAEAVHPYVVKGGEVLPGGAAAG
ncbi:MAG: MEDS domain-containing protein [Armatimonadota bacterium]|nr:MAG: MEDS domain-containing protein [Armatimonadota bacterium]